MLLPLWLPGRSGRPLPTRARPRLGQLGDYRGVLEGTREQSDLLVVLGQAVYLSLNQLKGTDVPSVGLVGLEVRLNSLRPLQEVLQVLGYGWRQLVFSQ